MSGSSNFGGRGGGHSDDHIDEDEELQLRRLMEEEDDEEEEEEIIFSAPEPPQGFDKLVQALQIPSEEFKVKRELENAMNMDALEWASELDEHGYADEKSASDETTTIQRDEEEIQAELEPLSEVNRFDGPCTYVLGGQSIVLGADMKGMEVLIRPDVAWKTVFACVEAVMLSQAMVKTSTTDSNSQNTTWTPQSHTRIYSLVKNVKITSGANAKKQRVVLVCLSINGGVRLDALLNVFGSFGRLGRATLSHGQGTNVGADEFVTSFLRIVYSAMYDQRLTIAHLQSATDAEVDTIIDVAFVQDLQVMYSTEMLTNLKVVAKSMDAYMHDLERKCACVMTCLQPVYELCEMRVPNPPPKKSISDYPLRSKMQSVSKNTPEAARWVLLKAKRNAAQFQLNAITQTQGFSTALQQPLVEHYKRVGALLRALFRELQSWCESEARDRIQRKTIHTCERVKDVMAYRAQLILTLNARRTHMQPLTRDAKAWSEFHHQFRIANVSEPLLFDTTCLHTKRQGRMYVTFSHIFFSGTVGGLQKVFPLYTISSISLDSTGILITNTAQMEEKFILVSAIPDFTSRVYEILTQVLDLYREARSQSVQRSRSTDSSSTRQRDPHDLLFDVLAAATDDTPQDERTFAGQPFEPELEVTAPPPESYVCDELKVLEQVRAVACEGFNRSIADDSPGAVTHTNPPRGSLASSIQAFLQQAQMQH